MDLVRSGKLDVAIAPSILDEFQRILRDKFNWQEKAIRIDVAEIKSCTRLVTPESYTGRGEERSE